MLVYIRECDRPTVMEELSLEKIPPHLKTRFDEENSINRKLEEDQVYL